MTRETRAPASRRTILQGVAATAGAALLPVRFAIGQTAKIKLGLMLPYTGTYAALGKNIDEALRLAVSEHGGTLGGRAVEYVVLGPEAEAAQGAENDHKVVE